MWFNISMMIFAVSLILGMIYSGMFQKVARTFSDDPAITVLHSSDMKEKQSDTTSGIQEKNARLIEDLKTKMERFKKP